MPVISRVVFLGFLSLASFGWWYAGSALSVIMEGFPECVIGGSSPRFRADWLVLVNAL